MKTCFKCNSTLPYSCFYKHSEMRDGYINKCKECTKNDASNNRSDNIEYYREYDRRRGNRQTQKYINSYRTKYPLAAKARAKVSREVKAGRIIKTPCEVCGKKEVCGHHDDYAKLTEVRWLCAACHKLWHKQNGEGLNKRMTIDEFNRLYI